jgi:hypothetical protein
MDTLIIRQKLYEYIKVADDEKVEAIYTIIKDDASAPYEWWTDDALIAELDSRSDDLKKGKVKGVSLEESRAHLLSRLKKNG